MTKNIQTIYNGYHFRSRTEARWAVFFDSAKIEYSYEPEGYSFDYEGENIPYLPDFKLFNIYGQKNLLLEVKPEEFYKSDEYWKYISKMGAFCEQTNHKMILACGIPKHTSYPLIQSHDPGFIEYTFFTTDHGSTEAKGGMLSGQFRLWSFASENEIVEELIPYCDAAKSARFEHGEKPKL